MTRKTNDNDGGEMPNTTASNRRETPSEVTDELPSLSTAISSPPLHWHHVEAMTGSKTDAEDLEDELGQYLKTERDIDYDLREGYVYEVNPVVKDDKDLFGAYRCWRVSSVSPEAYGSLHERTPRVKIDMWYELMSLGTLEMHLQSEVDVLGLPVVYGSKLDPRFTGSVLEEMNLGVDDPVPEDWLSQDMDIDGCTTIGDLIWNVEPVSPRYLSKILEMDPHLVNVEGEKEEAIQPATLLYINPEPEDLKGFLSESERTQFLDEIAKSSSKALSEITRRLRLDDRITVIAE